MSLPRSTRQSGLSSLSLNDRKRSFPSRSAPEELGDQPARLVALVLVVPDLARRDGRPGVSASDEVERAEGSEGVEEELLAVPLVEVPVEELLRDDRRER